MPLVMSLHKGEDIYVDGDRLVVDDILADDHFLMAAGDNVFHVVGDQAVQVLPAVLVFVGDRLNRNSSVAPTAIRVSIDAPRSKLILRGQHYRDSQQKRA